MKKLNVTTINPYMLNGFTLAEPNVIRIKASGLYLTVSQQVLIPTITSDKWHEIWRWTLPYNLQCDYYYRAPIIFNNDVYKYVDVNIYSGGVRAFLPTIASGRTLMICGSVIGWYGLD